MRADIMNTSVFSNAMRPRTAWRPAAALAALLALAGCTTQPKQSGSPSYLIITSLTAAPGAEPDSLGTVLASDVRTFGTAYSDPAVVRLQLGLKDPGTPASPSNFVTVTRYRVKYVRTDGGETPEAFEGAVTFTVSDTASGSITLVRAQTKVLSPLTQLAGLGGAAFLPVVAEVTFTGADQAGKDVSVTGFITINFADWADPGEDPVPAAASFTVTPPTGLLAGQVANFDASASTVPPGRSIVSYAWTFGDGSSGSGALASHVFPGANTYTVTLIVTDSAGQSYSVSRTVTVLP